MIRRRPTRSLAGAALVLAVLVSSFGAAHAGAPAGADARCARTGSRLGEPAPDAHDTGVTAWVFTFVDHSRPTYPDATVAPTDDPACRTLKVDVRAPSGVSGPLPLIVVVHGRDGDPAALRSLTDRWVSAGYVVAAPHFLPTEKGGDGKPTGAATLRQAADARFALDELLRLDADPASPLHGLIDERRIGAAGMSLGGMTVYGLVSNTCCRDRRITAALLLAAVHRPFPGGEYVPQRIPVMLVQGDADDGYHNSTSAYPALGAPKWFVTLHGSTHSPPFEVPRGPEARLVDDATTAFWDRYLHRNHRSAASRIVAAVQGADVDATLLRQRKRHPEDRTGD